MALTVSLCVGAFILGCAAGWLNSEITRHFVSGEISINKVMTANVLHLVVAAACLGLILLAVKLLKADYLLPLLIGALGVVAVPVIRAAVSGNSKK